VAPQLSSSSKAGASGAPAQTLASRTRAEAPQYHEPDLSQTKPRLPRLEVGLAGCHARARPVRGATLRGPIHLL
jgi:hypothetical protein